jgi:hypothetical protein
LLDSSIKTVAVGHYSKYFNICDNCAFVDSKVISDGFISHMYDYMHKNNMHESILLQFNDNTYLTSPGDNNLYLNFNITKSNKNNPFLLKKEHILLFGNKHHKFKFK